VTLRPDGGEALVLGPLLRYIGETAATIWVQTRDAGVVRVRAFGRSWESRTFGAHGCHYALVVLDGLEPGASSDYEVDVDGERVWPEAEPRFPGLPPSRVRTLVHHEAVRLAFGSCRTSVSHDAEGNAQHGVDALRAYARHLSRESTPAADWPHLVCFVGDQVYADETSEEMKAFIASRRSLDEPPWGELKDFVEYAHLYRLAWSDPLNRWLLSTLPSTMVFDDHDIRDDWNTSQSWHREMNAKPWWHERIVGGLASYWVYQHAGNLSPEDLAEDEIWRLIRAHAESGSDGELDLTGDLDAFAERADREPDTYRWSYARDLGESRLVVVDSRAARVLTPDRRSILDDDELAWVDRTLRGDVDHLFIATSLPFFLAPGIHDLEAVDEAMSEGAWGPRVGRVGERMRRALDLEHWAAFQEGFAEVLGKVLEVARGERGIRPGTVTFLSGDVHNSYVAEVVATDVGPGASRVIQAVCSPIRNPLPRGARVGQALLGTWLARPLNLLVRSTAKVPSAPVRWSVTDGPWFENTLATIEVRGRGLVIRWDAGEVTGERYDEPELRRIARVVIH
jgi:hypothetical protein